MRCLELFSGTGSVGDALRPLGYEVVSVDITDKFHTPTHKTDILTWDYTIYPPGHFDIVWASPPCESFSKCRLCWIGRKNRHFGDAVITKDMLIADEIAKGLPLLRKAQEIIAYFHPRRWVIENPADGRMKNYITEAPVVVDYCKYSDFGYKKPTAVWTNKTDFAPLRCRMDCDNLVTIEGKVLHRTHLGGSHWVKEDGRLKIIHTAADREKYKATEKVKLQNIQTDLSQKYRVPSKLVVALVE